MTDRTDGGATALTPKSEDERLRNVLSIVYGLLWPVAVDTTTESGARIREARQWCLRELSKPQQGDGIADANTIIHAMQPFPPYARRFEPNEAFCLVRADEPGKLREALREMAYFRRDDSTWRCACFADHEVPEKVRAVLQEPSNG